MERKRRMRVPGWTGWLALGLVLLLVLAGKSRGLEVRVAAGEAAGTLRVFLEPEEGESVYASSIAVLALAPAGGDAENLLPVREVEVQLPEPDAPPDEWHPMASYTRPFTFDIPAPAPGERLSLRLQRCSGEKCFLPETIPLEPGANAAGGDGGAVAEDGAEDGGMGVETRRWVGLASEEEFASFLAGDGQTPTEEPGGGVSPVEDGGSRGRGFVWALLMAVAGGLLLNMSPCVLPMIPVNLAILGAGAKSGWGRGRRGLLGTAYGVGMAAAYGGAGAAVVLTGGVFGSFAGHPAFHLAMAALLGVLAAALWGVGRLDLSRFRPRRRMPGGGDGGVRYGAALAAALAAGAVSALLAGACVAPVLVATLALSASLYAEGMRMALLLPFALGAGMALPWPLLAMGLAALPRPGAWMVRLQKGFAIFVGAFALYHAALAVAPFLPRKAAPDDGRHLTLDLGALEPDTSPESVVAGFAAGRPVLLDFGASWCKVCAVMHRTTLPAVDRSGALDGVAWVRIVADEPSREPAASFLRRHRIAGFPTYVLLEPAAASAPAGESPW